MSSTVAFDSVRLTYGDVTALYDISVAFDPGFNVVLPTAVPSIDPILLSVGGTVVSLGAVGVGWVTVSHWLDVKTLL